MREIKVSAWEETTFLPPRITLFSENAIYKLVKDIRLSCGCDETSCLHSNRKSLEKSNDFLLLRDLITGCVQILVYA
jgi:hypothetical protein